MMDEITSLHSFISLEWMDSASGCWKKRHISSAPEQTTSCLGCPHGSYGRPNLSCGPILFRAACLLPEAAKDTALSFDRPSSLPLCPKYTHHHLWPRLARHAGIAKWAKSWVMLNLRVRRVREAAALATSCAQGNARVQSLFQEQRIRQSHHSDTKERAEHWNYHKVFIFTDRTSQTTGTHLLHHSQTFAS